MYRSVLVPLDRSTFAEHALPLAVSIARRARARLDLVQVHELYALADPAAAIARTAEESRSDLIVMGTHGRRGLGRFLQGSVAERVMRRAPCPVLVVKTQGAGEGARRQSASLQGLG
jgi:nucleotide-binding universal stress UspA family protein